VLRLQTVLEVDGLAAAEVYDFLAEPEDRAYRRWWPGTHLRFHRLESHPDHVGDVVYVDEYVGKRRLRGHGIVTEAVPGKRLVWRVRRFVTLPAWLRIELAGDGPGVTITHTVEAGFGGVGKILDPLFRLYLTRTFAEALDEHVRTEFPLFRDRLDQIRDALGDG
jgi:Polyketide cyclase / dehydrase and lipid transport